MIQTMLVLSLFFFTIAIAVSVYRIIRGPSLPDRVLAMDLIGVNLVSGIAIFSILLNTKAFFDVILLIGILAFIGTIALSKFIERGTIIEYKRDR